jgi:beta-lactamase superfamily II metal-dependent hydrolase
MRMGNRWSVGLAVLLAMSAVAGAQGGSSARSASSEKGDLQVYFVDVEGGQSTLFVMPGGESLLVDTGNPGGRDAARIVAVCKLAGVTKIDTLLVTHYHTDHVGGLPEVAKMIPVGRFIDHGVNREDASVEGSKPTIAGYDAYQKVLADTHAEHLTVKPGDVLPVKGMHVEVVSADGEVIAKPLAAGGEQNPACASSPLKDAEGTENDRSVGMVLTFGKLRILDLGDLTWNKERGLMCPANKIGQFDVYIVSHHGLINSGSPALVDAIAPRVSIEDNGPHKGGAPSTYETIESTSRLKDMWQLHTAEVPAAKNVAESRIANLPATPASPDQANTLKLTGRTDGSFSVTNGRTGATVDYPAK